MTKTQMEKRLIEIGRELAEMPAKANFKQGAWTNEINQAVNRVSYAVMDLRG